VEHQYSTGLLRTLAIPEWKWEIISMDFITWFHMMARKHDLIMVVLDKFSKETHFIPVKSIHKTSDIARIFMKEIFKLHGLPKVIMLDRDAMFTSNFWQGLFYNFVTQLNFSIAYHPQTDGKIERVNKVIEDML